MLSSLVQLKLQQAGWSKDRRVSIDEEVNALQIEGYPVFPMVKVFLQKFGGLSVEWTSEVSGALCRMHFNAAEAAAEVYNEGYISKFSKRIGQPVCVIGEILPDATTLIMDVDGKIYGGFAEHLVLFGNDSEEAFNNILNGHNKYML